jgi:tetratricopeptide (TPR) repeat protein
MGLVCAQQGNSDKAGEYLRQAIELSNESPSDYMEDRLECRLLRRELESLLEASRTERDAISQGKFEEVAACFEKAIECEPDNATHALIRTQLLVLTERTDEYRQACGEMLDRFGQSADPINLNIAARACALAPQAIADPGKAVELAQRAVKIDPSAPLYHRVLGLTQLRAGQATQAVDSFQESLRKPSIPPVMQLLNWFGLALACQQRGELDEARSWQEKALKSLDLANGTLLQSSLEVELLRRETESLLGNPEREGDDDQMEQRDVSVNERSP